MTWRLARNFLFEGAFSLTILPSCTVYLSYIGVLVEVAEMGMVQLPDYYVSEYLASGELVEVLASYRDDREGGGECSKEREL